jgi:hypothetical protein
LFDAEGCPPWLRGGVATAASGPSAGKTRREGLAWRWPSGWPVAATPSQARQSQRGGHHGSAVVRVGDASAPSYGRHEPDKTVLYQIVSEHLETFMEEVRNDYDKPLPAYLEKELGDFLRCGLLQHGFARYACDRCKRSILVAFSCKPRAACPSCCVRRMCNSAAFLVDHVLPEVPLRQWVLSVPFLAPPTKANERTEAKWAASEPANEIVVRALRRIP